MNALLNPVNRARGIKWLLVAHTVAIFLFVTVFTVVNLDILSLSYIDNREAHGDTVVPGPLGYQSLTYSMAVGIISTLMFLLNNLLVDGLLVRLSSSQSPGCPT
jgi:ABC-type Fe3+ transport system permease subunit